MSTVGHIAESNELPKPSLEDIRGTHIRGDKIVEYAAVEGHNQHRGVYFLAVKSDRTCI